MASIVVHGKHPSERFVTIANNIQLSWENKTYPGGVWSLDVGVRDITKDNPEILKWAQKRWPDGLPSSTRVTKEYVTHLMDNVLPEGANYKLKGQAIQGQNMPGTEFGKGASGARKDDLYFKWWGDRPEVQRLPDGSLLYQADALGSNVTRPPTSGAPNEYIEALSKEDWRKRKRLSPNQKIKNSYGEQWGIPREKWWKVEGTGEGGIEGRLKTKGLAYDNFKTGIRRALTKGKTLQMSPWEWDAVYEAYKYAQKHGYHVDHIDPISGTGYHVWDNLQILDANDNLVKGAKTDIQGIIPKRTTYLTQGPLTEQDWVKYTKKNAGLATRRSNFLKRGIGEGVGLLPKTFGGAVVRAIPIIGFPLDVNAAVHSGIDVWKNPNDPLKQARFAADATSVVAQDPYSGLVSLGTDIYEHRKAIGRHIQAKATDNWGLSRLWYKEPENDHTNKSTTTD